MVVVPVPFVTRVDVLKTTDFIKVLVYNQEDRHSDIDKLIKNSSGFNSVVDFSSFFPTFGLI